MQKNFLVGFVVLVLLILGGCAGRSESQSFVRDDVDFAFYRRIAVLPFSNNTNNQHADERIRHITATQVQAMGLFEVVDNGVVDSVMQDEAIEPGDSLNVASLERLSQMLNVDAFMLGAVDEFTTERASSFSYPIVSLTLRLLDPKGGTVLWQVNGHRNGYSTAGRLFGLESRNEYQVTSDLVRELLSSGLAR